MLHVDHHKLGGAALKDASQMSQALGVIARHSSKPKVVVVSAFYKATDQLIQIRNAIESGNQPQRDNLCQQFAQRHLLVAHQLGLNGEINQHLAFMYEVIGTQPLGEPISPQHKDLIDSLGEQISAVVVTQAFKAQGIPAITIDSAQLLVARGEFGNGYVILDKSVDRVHRVLGPLLHEGIIPVVTGFYGGSESGERKLLGRNATDYVATCLAAAISTGDGIRCDGVYMWKQGVDGVGYEDPQQNPDTPIYDRLGYREAADIAQDAQVLHWRTMEPVAALEIPIYVKNISNPLAEGTRIGPERES